MCKGSAPAPASPHAVTAPLTSQRPPCLTWPFVHTHTLPCDPCTAALRAGQEVSSMRAPPPASATPPEMRRGLVMAVIKQEMLANVRQRVRAFARVQLQPRKPAGRLCPLATAAAPTLPRQPTALAACGRPSGVGLRAAMPAGRPLSSGSAHRNITHYDRLGIRPPSDPKTIKSSYLKRAKECHPDIHGPSKTQEFQEVSQAFTVLR